MRILKIGWISLLLLIPCSLLFGSMAGGEISFTCLGNNNYEIKVKVYWDCYAAEHEIPTPEPIPDPLSVTFFQSNNLPAWQIGQEGVIELDLMEEGSLEDTTGQSELCYFIPVTACLNYGVYTATVTLPFIPGGYYVAAGLPNRKTQITNTRMTTTSGPILTLDISETALSQCLSSSEFPEIDRFYYCIDEELEVDMALAQSESDSVVYEFYHPYFNTWFTPPFNPVRFEDGFGVNNFMGGADPLRIDPYTGKITGTADRYGVFVVGVSAREYLNGEEIGTIYRDFFMYVGDCEGANADFEILDFYCRTTRISFNQISESFLSSKWIFGDPDDPIRTSTSDRPEITFPGFGEYSVTRITFGPSEECHDTVTQTVVLKPDEVELYFEVDWEDCTGDSIHFTITAYSDLVDLDTIDFEMSVWWGNNSVSTVGTEIDVSMESRYSVMIRPEIHNENICAWLGATHLTTGVVFNAGLEEEYFLCEGSLVLDDHFDSRNEGHDFVWTPTDGILSPPDNQVITVSPDTATTYVGQATRNNCTGEFTYNIGVYKPGTAFLPDTICGRNYQVEDNPFYGFTDRSIWRFYQGGILVGSRTDDFPQINFPNYGEAIVELTPFGFDGINCPDTISQKVYILNPEVDWDVELTILECSDSLRLLIGGDPHGNFIGEEVYIFVSSLTDTLQSSSLQFEITVPLAEQLDFQLILETDKGCFIEESFSLPIPYDESISGSDHLRVCAGDTAVLDFDLVDGMEIAWADEYNFLTDQGEFPAKILPDSTSEFALTITYNQCEYDYFFEVEVLSVDSIEVDDILICDDQLLQELDFTTLEDEEITAWSIRDSNGELVSGGSDFNPAIQFPDYGYYTLEFEFAGSDLCGKAAIAGIYIGKPGSWEVSIETLEEECIENEVSLKLTSSFTGSFPDGLPNKSEWLIIALDTLSFTGDTVNLRLDDIDQFEVFFTTLDRYGCLGMDRVHFEFDLLDLPKENDTLQTCRNQAVELWPDSPQEYDYIWSPATGLVGGLTDWNPEAAPEVSTLFTAEVSTFNCQGSHQVYVDLLPSPVISEISADPEVIMGEGSSVLNLQIDGPADEIEWFPPGDLDNPFVRNPVATPNSSTVYSAIVTSESGCSDTASILLEVEDFACAHPYVFIPNAFSPNGDGQNDILYVRGDHIVDVELMVYDRYGRKVFQSPDLDRGWDGTLDGREAPAGVYSYFLEVRCENGEHYSKSGNITLIR